MFSAGATKLSFSTNIYSSTSQVSGDTPVSPLNPQELFANGETGVLFRASELSSLFEEHTQTTPASQGSLVGYWGDISGNSSSLQQVTSDQRPTLEQDAKGNWYVGGTSSNDWLSGASFSGVGDCCIFAAFEFVDDGVNYSRVFDGGYNTGFWIGRRSTALEVGGGTAEGVFPYGQFGAVQDGDKVYVIMDREKSTGLTELIFSGQVLGSRETAVNQNLTGTVAAGAAGGSYASRHKLYELGFVHRRITSGEKEGLKAYLQQVIS